MAARSAGTTGRGEQEDWGARSPRWAGIYSEVVDVKETRVHLLRAEARADAPPGAPTHLLVHPMGASGTLWLDVMARLSAYGPVIAPDLPGSLAGRTRSPHHRAARAEENARFLAHLASTLALDWVVTHGWSLGGLEALLFVDLEPSRHAGLILTNPTLPGPLTRSERLFWNTAGRFGMWIGPPAMYLCLRMLGPKLVTYKQRQFHEAMRARRVLSSVGGDLSRISSASATLLVEEQAEMLSHPQQITDAVVAFTSALSGMYLNPRPAETAIRRVVSPTLLLWGDQDPLIDHAVIDRLMTRRPDWALHVFETVGHLLPLEVPDGYIDVVGRWLVEKRVVGRGAAGMNGPDP